MRCFFVSDLHGKPDRYRALFKVVNEEKPDGVFIGGDLLPGGYAMSSDPVEFMHMLASKISVFRDRGTEFFVIMGNDDPRIHESMLEHMEEDGILHYPVCRAVDFGGLSVVGYPFVPPSPFLLKDWERYDVSRYVGLGAVSPEEGLRTVPVSEQEARYSTISGDLEKLAELSDPARTIYLFHAPPHETCLDMLDNHGKFIDHAPADRHVGSIAIRRFIEKLQPLVTLHGHIHESARVSGRWIEIMGNTSCLGASHDGPELALVRFDTEDVKNSAREIVPI